MGATASDYQDGDIPREDMSVLYPPGFAYYSSSVRGKCSVCEKDTNMWQVSIKAKGNHLCKECDTKIKIQREELMTYYTNTITKKNEQVI